MSHPLPDASFTVVPDGVEALATELRGLAAELTGAAEHARSAATGFPAALGDEGWAAGATARSWAHLYELVAARTGVLAGTFSAAVAAYVAEDVWLASRTAPGRSPR